MLASHRTKITATLGPASASLQVISSLIEAGMDVARLNFAHGTHEQHERSIKTVRKAAEMDGMPVGILQDLPGPKLRVGVLPRSSMSLVRDEEVILTHSPQEVPEKNIPILYSRIAVDLKPGHTVYIADGLIRLRVQSVRKGKVRCRVVNGGTVRSGNGVNMPHSSLTLDAFTQEDGRHLSFGLRQQVDFVGISFVGNAEDIKRVRVFCRRRGADPFLIAKIERRQALQNLAAIIEAADGIMVARGDLGVEVPFSEIPGLQKRIVFLSRQKGKPVIVATQVLESMVQNPRPTRAEATDISNAVLEGADSIMLSGETATGKYPRESVSTLRQVIQAAEKTNPILGMDVAKQRVNLSDIIAHEACHIAERIRAKVIVIPSRSGGSVARVSRFRPTAPVLAMVKTEKLRRRLCLYWGVHTLANPKAFDFLKSRSALKAALFQAGAARPGDNVLLVSGDPAAMIGDTSLVQAIQI